MSCVQGRHSSTGPACFDYVTLGTYLSLVLTSYLPQFGGNGLLLSCSCRVLLIYTVIVPTVNEKRICLESGYGYKWVLKQADVKMRALKDFMAMLRANVLLH